MAKKHAESRGIRDEMNVGPDPRQARHLVPLKELGKVRVADGDPDVRGWEVFTSTGREIGTVDDMLVDTDAGEVVMLDIDLKRNDRHTLAPVRAAWIDHTTRRVVIDAAEVSGADEMPSLARNARTSDEEAARFDERYGRVYAAHDDDREYRVRHGEEELRFNRREAALGGAGAAAAAATPEPSVPRRSTWVERHPLQEPERYRGSDAASEERELRYRRLGDRRPSGASATSGAADEVVLERRPYVEEVVMRRRAADDAGTTPLRDDAANADDRAR